MAVPAFLSRWVNLKDAVLKHECERIPSADAKELADKLDGMNMLADYLQVPNVHEAVGIEHHHLGMYDTTKIAMILNHLVVSQGFVVRETATRDLATGKWQPQEGPRIRELSDRTKNVSN